jgi:hypothetical protein
LFWNGQIDIVRLSKNVLAKAHEDNATVCNAALYTYEKRCLCPYLLTHFSKWFQGFQVSQNPNFVREGEAH